MGNGLSAFYCFSRSSVDGASESSGNHRCEFAEAVRELAATGECASLAFLLFLTGKLRFLGFKQPLNPSERFLRSLSSRPLVAGRSSLRPPSPATWTHPVVRKGGQALAGALGGMVSCSFGLSFSLQSLGTEKHFSCYS